MKTTFIVIGCFFATVAVWTFFDEYGHLTGPDQSQAVQRRPVILEAPEPVQHPVVGYEPPANKACETGYEPIGWVRTVNGVRCVKVGMGDISLNDRYWSLPIEVRWDQGFEFWITGGKAATYMFKDHDWPDSEALEFYYQNGHTTGVGGKTGVTTPTMFVFATKGTVHPVRGHYNIYERTDR